MALIEQVHLPAPSGQPVVLGVVSDTHVPDRARQLHPGLLPALRAAGVAAILHAGDIAIPAVLAELRQAAPVVAVRGNRDIFMRQKVPMSVQVYVGETQIGLTHGHGGMGRYLADKVRLIRAGYELEYYRQYLRHLFPGAAAIVFGHTHRPEVEREPDGSLLFNPGSASGRLSHGYPPTYGLLTVHPDGRVEGKVLSLQG